MDMNELVLISIDDHVIEPPNAFIDHYPAHAKHRAPRIEQSNGQDVWIWEGGRFPSLGLNAVAGRPREEYGVEPTAYDQMRKGCYDPLARVDDMNVNGVLASVNFPTFPAFAGNTFLRHVDKEAALIAVRAYNDWHLQDWCGKAPGRFIPMIILPLWDMSATLDEIKRMSELDVHAISFPDNPVPAGLPSIHSEYWEPLWKGLSDHQMVINCHIGSGYVPPHASDDTPHDAWIATMPISIANSAADWTFAEFWDRYPDLRMALSEGGIGWIPYFLERADFTYEHHHQWTHTDFGGKRPSDRFKQHVMACFIDDRFGVANLEFMNENMVSWECDYPHSDSVWPNCPEYLWACVKMLPPSTIDKITHENVMREYNFDPFSLLGGRQNCDVGALRAQATDVDTTPRSGLGGLNAEAEQEPGARQRPITTGEVLRMMEKA